MVRVAPFRGLTYNPAKVRDLSHVVSPPYDVITPEDQEKLYRRSRRNVVRLILSRDPDPYHSAARVFEKWQEEGVLVRSERPAVYFVSHRFQDPERGEKERLGFVALARMEDGAEGGIYPHENAAEALSLPAADESDRARAYTTSLALGDVALTAEQWSLARAAFSYAERVAPRSSEPRERLATLER